METISIPVGFFRPIREICEIRGRKPLRYKIVFLGSMNFLDVLLLSLAAVFIIIGIYEIMALGLGQAYWAIMISAISFFIYSYRKRRKA